LRARKSAADVEDLGFMPRIWLAQDGGGHSSAGTKFSKICALAADVKN